MLPSVTAITKPAFLSLSDWSLAGDAEVLFGHLAVLKSWNLDFSIDALFLYTWEWYEAVRSRFISADEMRHKLKISQNSLENTGTSLVSYTFRPSALASFFSSRISLACLRFCTMWLLRS
jgi:hypothetical protein